MRILVTGGAGYIGTHTLVELLDAGHEVHVVDNLVAGDARAFARVARITGREPGLSRADIRDADALHAIIARWPPDAVIHFAGLKSPTDSLAIPDLYAEVNVRGSQVLLDALAVSACRCIVFSSSAAVYGPPDALPVREDHPRRPTTPYGAGKAEVEDRLAALGSDWSVASLRYFNPVGAHESGLIGEVAALPARNLLPQIIDVAAGGRPALEIYGGDYDTPDGTGLRDFIHVSDLARAHLAALERTATTRGAAVFNIGTGRGVSVREMAETFARVTGRAVPIRIAPRRKGDVAACYADPARAQAVLGWRAGGDIEVMCRSAFAWHERNPRGYATEDAEDTAP